MFAKYTPASIFDQLSIRSSDSPRSLPSQASYQVLFWWPGTLFPLLCLDNSYSPSWPQLKHHLFLDLLAQRSIDFLIKGQRANIVRFAGCAVPAATVQLCHCRAKVVLDDTNKWDWLNSNKILLAKRGPRLKNGLQLKACSPPFWTGTRTPGIWSCSTGHLFFRALITVCGYTSIRVTLQSSAYSNYFKPSGLMRSPRRWT